MASRVDCVVKILGKHGFTLVEKDENFVEADDFRWVKDRVWIFVELRYNQLRQVDEGVEIARISEGIETTSTPSPISFRDKTKDYRDTAYVQGLLKSINDDIRKTCK